ncbi:MAG: GNAT family N-acetyltransferase [Actinomycetota bacterium]
MASGEVEIREADPDDARAVARVQVGSWRWAYRGHVPEETLSALDVVERESRWRDAIPDGDQIVLVAVDPRGAVVGFAHAAGSDDADAASGTAQLYAIYLGEEAAGKGIGRALLARVSDEMRSAGFARTTLWVLESNEHARRFYERAGWSWDGTRSAHQVQCANLPIVRYAVDL